MGHWLIDALDKGLAQLRADVATWRDRAIAAEAQVGDLESRIWTLRAEVARLTIEAEQTKRDAIHGASSLALLAELCERYARFDGLVAQCNDLTRRRDDLEAAIVEWSNVGASRADMLAWLGEHRAKGAAR